MRICYLFWLCTVCFFSCKSSDSSQKSRAKELCIAFYNVENLFDTSDNPDKIDEDFTPEGRYKWTEAIYQEKLNNLAKAISSINQVGPDILGIAEVENRSVVEDLTQMPALKAHGYMVVHEESPDMRGIDVALIYNPKVFTYISHTAHEVVFPQEPDYTSRKVLLVKGKIKKEILYLLVNHWPSRYGGQEESEFRRVTVALKVRSILDEIRKDDPQANLLLMGDFNDDPFNKSISEVLQAQAEPINLAPDALFNAHYLMHQVDSVGTLTYRGKWNLFDQILLSPSLLQPSRKLSYIPQSVGIHRPEFMQVGGDGPAKDMPRRAIYRGEFQKNGYSDHFPVYVRLRY